MAKYKDYQFDLGEYNKASEYFDNDALILGIRNILLSRPGNFPFNPSLGMDIKKYQFDLLDDKTISDINKELGRQLSLYMPDLQNIQVNVSKVDGNNGEAYLGIIVMTTMNGENVNASFLLSKNENDIVSVFNETY